MRLLSITTFLAALALPVLFGGTSPRFATVALTSVQVLDDRLRSVEGVAIQLADLASNVDGGATDEDGQTWWLGIDPSAGAELVISDTVTPHGLLLGSVEYFTAPLLEPGKDLHLWYEGRTAPLAIPVSIQGNPTSTNNIIPNDGSWPHWNIVVPQGSSLQFSAKVATLMDQEAIEAYGAYRGVDLSAGNYVRGVVVVCPTVQLSDDGIVVSIALLGDLSGQTPVIDAFNIFQKRKTLPTGPPVAVDSVVVNGTGADEAFIRVRGTLRKGQLALLVRSNAAGPASAQYVMDDPRDVTIPSAPSAPQVVQGPQGALSDYSPNAMANIVSAGAGAPEGMVTDCLPPEPNTPANWGCTPATPSACAGATAIDTDCKITKQKSPVVCRSGGSTVSKSTGKTQKFKVSLNFKGKTGATETSGGFEYGVDSTTVHNDAWTADPGASNLGECTRYWHFTLVCGTRWAIKKDLVLWHPYTSAVAEIEIHPCAVDATATTACDDSINSQSECDRTP